MKSQVFAALAGVAAAALPGFAHAVDSPLGKYVSATPPFSHLNTWANEDADGGIKLKLFFDPSRAAIEEWVETTPDGATALVAYRTEIAKRRMGK